MVLDPEVEWARLLATGSEGSSLSRARGRSRVLRGVDEAWDYHRCWAGFDRGAILVVGASAPWRGKESGAETESPCCAVWSGRRQDAGLTFGPARPSKPPGCGSSGLS